MESLFAPVILGPAILVIWLLSSVKVINEYERGVVFTFGRLRPNPLLPGFRLVIFPIQRMMRVSLRTVVLDVTPQDIITRDNVTVKVNAVIYFRVIDANRSIVEVENYLYATTQLAQTTLRSVLGEVELDDLLSKREELNARLQMYIDKHADPWGIKVSMVEIKAVDLPQLMVRAISRQAEAEREKRAKIIHAEGELKASHALLEAARKLAEEPLTIQLRYLQTLTEIGVENNSTIVFPLPLDMITAFQGSPAARRALTA
ncbi:MAG: slipin family protein [Acidobacteria bacterium]|nr:slipin family protein [Acidobacteriota bacterium]